MFFQSQYAYTCGWIPSHQATPGNEDKRLVKEGATGVPPNQFTDVPFSVGKKKKKTHQEAFGTEALDLQYILLVYRKESSTPAQRYLTLYHLIFEN
jgi:hypothetical protein